MNISIKALAMSTLLIFSSSGIAQQAHHQGSNSSNMENMQHNMGNMEEMQTHMLLMHDLSNKILAETDPKKQAALKNQQLELMKAHHKQMMAAHHGTDGKMQHDMSKMTEHLKQKQEHMLMMHDLSNKILAEKDPQKKQILKNQQLDLMKAYHAQMMSVYHKKTTESPTN